MSWKQTYTGRKFDFCYATPADVDIRDIAHALSLICRYNGHCEKFYSVAQHSVYVSQLVPRDLALCGLLHDAAEAYVGDIITPVKLMIPAFKELERQVMALIATKYEIPLDMPEAIRSADLAMLAAEKRDLMKESPEPWDLPVPPASIRIVPWPAERAEAYFLGAFRRLTRITAPAEVEG